MITRHNTRPAHIPHNQSVQNTNADEKPTQKKGVELYVRCRRWRRRAGRAAEAERLLATSVPFCPITRCCLLLVSLFPCPSLSLSLPLSLSLFLSLSLLMTQLRPPSTAAGVHGNSLHHSFSFFFFFLQQICLESACLFFFRLQYPIRTFFSPNSFFPPMHPVFDLLSLFSRSSLKM